MAQRRAPQHHRIATKLGIPPSKVKERADRRKQHRQAIGECQRCRHKGSMDELTIHHIEPLESGGPDAPCNWAVLCRGCHDDWHKLEAELRAILARQRFRQWMERGQRRRDGEMPRL